MLCRRRHLLPVAPGAFIPGNRFEGMGYLLSATGTLQVHGCRGLSVGEGIEITSGRVAKVVEIVGDGIS
jgi:hypothetical protein